MSSYHHSSSSTGSLGGGGGGVIGSGGGGGSSSSVGGGGGGGGGSGGFPLRTNYFRSLPLTRETMEALYVDAKQNAHACLSQSFNDQWRYVPPEKDGTQLRKDTSNLAESYRLIRAATVLRCQEHEVNMVIANTNTDSWREFMRKCFGKHYIDTLILHSFTGPMAAKTSAGGNNNNSDNNRPHRVGSERPGPEDEAIAGAAGRPTLWMAGVPGDLDVEGDAAEGNNNNNQGLGSSNGSRSDSSGRPRRNSETRSLSDEDDGCGDEPAADELLTVKWGALDTGGQGKRDLCVVDFLSTMSVPNTENRERVHCWCFSSVEGERVGCMALKDTHGISRASLTKLGVFWRRVNDEETEVIVCGSFASKHAKFVSAVLLQSLHRLQGIVEDLRLSNQIYIHRSTWVKDHERSSCHLCMRNFYALRRKHHCRKCGEVICSDCSVVENVDLPVIGYSKLRLCKVCCLKAKSTPLKRNDKANVFDHLVRARSLSNINISSPFNAAPRMSFADTGSSNGSGGTLGSHNNNNNSNPLPSSSSSSSSMLPPQRQPSPPSNNQALDASTRSSSSFSSSNNNDFEVPDALEDFATTPSSTTAVNGASSSSAQVFPIPSLVSTTSIGSKDGRGLSAATTSSSSASSTPMLAPDDDDLDDFIDVRCLNKQLSALELKQKQANGGRGGRSNMFDLLCELACQTLNCPIASVSILDATGESIRSATGLNDQPDLDDELTLFVDKVMGSTPSIVLDANVDKHVQSLFARRGAPTIRFFAGCPIYSRTGKKLGYVCVADVTKRDTLGPSGAFTMERLATLAVTTMERNLAAKDSSSGSGSGTSNSIPMADYVPPATPSPYVTGTHLPQGIYAATTPTPVMPRSHSSTSTTREPTSQSHPAAIFDRPAPRHRQNSTNVHHPPPPPPPPSSSSQYHHQSSAPGPGQGYYPSAQPMHARVYDISDPDVGMYGSPMGSPSMAPPVAPMPRSYHHHHHHHHQQAHHHHHEYSAGYYEAQERMRKLLIKSYHTQQQLATGGSLAPPPQNATGSYPGSHAPY